MSMRIVHTEPVPDRRILPLSKAAKYLGVSRSTLEKYTAEGQLHAFDFMGRRVYKLEELDSVVAGLKQWQPHQTREGSRKEIE